MIWLPPGSTLFPYTTLFRSLRAAGTDDTTESGECVVQFHSSPRKLVSTEQNHVGRGLLLRPVHRRPRDGADDGRAGDAARSEEHTSELQSHVNLVCRLLLEK